MKYNDTVEDLTAQQSQQDKWIPDIEQSIEKKRNKKTRIK